MFGPKGSRKFEKTLRKFEPFAENAQNLEPSWFFKIIFSVKIILIWDLKPIKTLEIIGVGT